MKKIAFFDFDGTLTSKDSLTEFYKYMYKKDFFFYYYLRNTFLFFLVKLGVVNYRLLKMKRIKFLVNKYSLDFLLDKSGDFFNSFVKTELKKKGKSKMIELSKKGFEIVIVSASIDLLLKHFAKEFNVKIITNELEQDEGNFTGKFLHGKDCNFGEKVNRIKEKYNLKEYNEVLAYGDSEGDYAMFEIADKSFLNHFK